MYNETKEAFESATLSVEEITCNLLYKILGYKNLEIKEDKKTLKVVLNIKNKARGIIISSNNDNVMKTKQFKQTYEDSAKIRSNIQNLKQKGMFTELLDKFLASKKNIKKNGIYSILRR